MLEEIVPVAVNHEEKRCGVWPESAHFLPCLDLPYIQYRVSTCLKMEPGGNSTQSLTLSCYSSLSQNQCDNLLSYYLIKSPLNMY